MRADNSYKKSLSLRKVSVQALWVLLLIACQVSPAGAVDFWDITVVDSAGGGWTSVATLPSGYPAISYSSQERWGDLKYAWYDGNTWQKTTIDSPGDVLMNSLAILPSGHPAISYSDWWYGSVKYAWYDGSNWQTTIIGYEGGGSSLAVLPSGEPAIAYSDHIADSLNYAWHDGGGWH